MFSKLVLFYFQCLYLYLCLNSECKYPGVEKMNNLEVSLNDPLVCTATRNFWWSMFCLKVSWRMMGFITASSGPCSCTGTYQLGIYHHCLYSASDILPSSAVWWPSWHRNHRDLGPFLLRSQCLTCLHDSMVSESQVLHWQDGNYTWSLLCVYKSPWSCHDSII